MNSESFNITNRKEGHKEGHFKTKKLVILVTALSFLFGSLSPDGDQVHSKNSRPELIEKGGMTDDFLIESDSDDVVKGIVTELGQIDLPENFDERNLLELSFNLAQLEKKLSDKVDVEITPENFQVFFSQLGPEILKILSDEKLSYGVWNDRSFKAQPRNELPLVTIETPDKMAGASAQTNYRKGTIRFNADLFQGEKKKLIYHR